MMTTAPDANVRAVAVEGTFDDCQALVKGDVQSSRLPRRVRLSGVNSINWARIVAQAVYYFTAAIALGAPHRKVAFTVPTGNFGDIFAGYVAARMGLPVDRLVVATNVNDILVRALASGSYETHDVIATSSPSMDIQVSSNFERLLFDAAGRDPAAVRAMMGSLAQSQRFAIAPRALSEMRNLFSADRASEDEVAATIRTTLRETGRCIDPHTAVAVAVAEKETARPGCAHDRAVDRACREIPRCGGGRLRHPPGLAGLAVRSRSPPGKCHGAAAGSGRNRNVYNCGIPRRAWRCRSMSVELTRLPSGLTVVTDAMAHLESASLGVWVGAGSRDEREDEHGVSHLLEHMAFKGTKRRTARQIAEEIEAVGGDLNAATSVETTAYYARVLKADVPLALDVLSDILADPSFDPAELKREQNVIVQEIGAVEDGPSDLVFEYLQETAFPDQPVGRSILGTPDSVCGFGPTICARISRAITVRPTWSWSRPARSTTRASSPMSSGALRASRRPRGPSRSPPNSAAAAMSSGATSNRRISPSASRACRSAIPALLPADFLERDGRGNVVAAVPGSAGNARPLLFDLLLSMRPIRIPASSGFTPERIRRPRPS